MTLTAGRAAFLAKELNGELKTFGAKNASDAVMPRLLDSFVRIMKDPIFAEQDFSQGSIMDFVYQIALIGDPLQRAAMTRHLDKCAGFAFKPLEFEQSASAGNFNRVMGMIADRLGELAFHFGKSYEGDIKSGAYSLITDYAGLSVVDFMLFFGLAKSGRYKTDFQAISTRGINYEFVTDWLDKFVAERQLDWQVQYENYKEPQGVGVGEKTAGSILEEINRAKAAAALKKEARAKLESDADLLRKIWQDKITENVVFVEEGGVLKTIGGGYKPDGIERVIKRIIYEFVTFGDAQKTGDLYGAFESMISERYKGDEDFRQKIYLEKRHYIIAFNKLIREVSPTDLFFVYFKNAYESQIKNLIEVSAVEQQKEMPTGGKMESLVCKRIYFLVKEEIEKQENAYYEEYLPKCIEAKYTALTKEEFIFEVALRYHFSTTGENPVQKLLDL